MKFVLDSSAIVALLRHEPGVANILKYKEGLFIASAVIATESAAKLVCAGTHRIEAERLVLSIVPEILPFDEEDMAIILKFAPAAREYGLSLADMACISLAIKEKCPVITADKAWKKLKIPAEVIVFR